MTHTPNHHSDAIIDDTTLAIVDEVRRDARISVSALAHKLGISRSFASSRLNALSEAGIIRRYTVDIDPHALGKKSRPSCSSHSTKARGTISCSASIPFPNSTTVRLPPAHTTFSYASDPKTFKACNAALSGRFPNGRASKIPRRNS